MNFKLAVNYFLRCAQKATGYMGVSAGTVLPHLGLVKFEPNSHFYNLLVRVTLLQEYCKFGTEETLLPRVVTRKRKVMLLLMQMENEGDRGERERGKRGLLLLTLLCRPSYNNFPPLNRYICPMLPSIWSSFHLKLLLWVVVESPAALPGDTACIVVTPLPGNHTWSTGVCLFSYTAGAFRFVKALFQFLFF